MKKSSHDQYWWIMEHPAFNKGGESSPRIEITPHLVCAETGRVEPYAYLNTQMQFWVELCCDLYSTHEKRWISHHLWELDCGGTTWNDAVDSLYEGVMAKYGDYCVENDTVEYESKIFFSGRSDFLEGNSNVMVDRSSDYKWDDSYDADAMRYEIENTKKLIGVIKKRSENKFCDKEKTKERLLYCNRIIQRAEQSLMDKVHYE